MLILIQGVFTVSFVSIAAGLYFKSEKEFIVRTIITPNEKDTVKIVNFQ